MQTMNNEYFRSSTHESTSTLKDTLARRLDGMFFLKSPNRLNTYKYI